MAVVIEDINKESVLQAIRDHATKAAKEAKIADFDAAKYMQRFDGKNAQEALAAYAADVTKKETADKTKKQEIVTGEVLLGAEKLEEKREKGTFEKLGERIFGGKDADKAAGADRPEIKIKGADGKDYTLEPKEYLAYVKSATRDANGNISQPVDQWATQKGVAFTGQGTSTKVDDTEYYIETPVGKSRTVGKGIVTEPLVGASYGAIKGLKVGDRDDLDVYISTEGMKRLAEGKAPMEKGDKVYVMQQMAGGKVDELKVGMGFASLADFQKAQASTWGKDAHKFSELNEGKYVELTQEQFTAMKEQIKANPSLTMDQFLATDAGKGVTPVTLDKIPAPAVAGPAPAAEAAAPAASAPAATKPELSFKGFEKHEPIKFDQPTLDLQKNLKAAGLDLGSFGAKKDGLDGKMGEKTSEAAQKAAAILVAKGALKPNDKGEVPLADLATAMKDPKNQELVKADKDKSLEYLKKEAVAAYGAPSATPPAPAQTTQVDTLINAIKGAKGVQTNGADEDNFSKMKQALMQFQSSGKDVGGKADAAMREFESLAQGAVGADNKIDIQDKGVIDAMKGLRDQFKGLAKPSQGEFSLADVDVSKLTTTGVKPDQLQTLRSGGAAR